MAPKKDYHQIAQAVQSFISRLPEKEFVRYVDNIRNKLLSQLEHKSCEIIVIGAVMETGVAEKEDYLYAHELFLQITDLHDVVDSLEFFVAEELARRKKKKSRFSVVEGGKKSNVKSQKSNKEGEEKPQA